MNRIQDTLERWGAWAADNHETVYWPPIAAGFSGLIPSKVRSRAQCTEDEGLAISMMMARLNARNPAAHDLLFDYYVLGRTFMQLAKAHRCSDTHIGKKLVYAEGLLEGFIIALEVSV